MYNWRNKALSALGLAASIAVLAIARCLHPSASGVGTHVQLGLPPCRFLAVLGIPCPSCGLTTSFAFAAHLQFEQAFAASPFGLLLFLAVVLAIPVICIQLYKRSASLSILGNIDLSVLAIWTVAAYLASWFYKLTMATALGPIAGQ
jgi:hypothetical protein